MNSVIGEATVAATTAKEMKADILKRVGQMYDCVKDAGDNLKIKRFSLFLDDMMTIAGEIDEKGLMEDEQMCDVWWLIMMFVDEVANGISIGYAREHLEMRLLSIIKTLQGEKILFRG